MVTIDELLRIAKGSKASDVHITVGVPPILRINGALIYTKYDKMTPQDTEDIIKPIMSELSLQQYITKGQSDFSYSHNEIGRFRINVFRQRGSMAAAIRLVMTETPNPVKLGVPESVINLCDKKRGLVLVTGPTGSGKSTTLASLIDQINRNRKCHIITLEDPIEYLHSHQNSIVNQREIGMDSKSFADALRASLREDPDVILVGEMRDLETISIAITAAETGHLVLSTLHTIGAANTIDRIVDVFPPHQQQQIRFQISTVLQSVVSQQLLPLANKSGRVAAFEVMHSNPAIRNLIREAKTHQIQSTMQTNKGLGMVTMDDAIIDLLAGGYIDRENAIQFSQDPISMEKRLGTY